MIILWPAPGIQSIFHNKPKSAWGIMGLTNGGQQRVNDYSGTNTSRHLYGACASFHINGSWTIIQSGTSKNPARWVDRDFLKINIFSKYNLFNLLFTRFCNRSSVSTEQLPRHWYWWNKRHTSVVETDTLQRKYRSLRIVLEWYVC